MAPVIRTARSELTNPTLRAFADWLNARDYKTVEGKVWRAQTVSNLLSVDDLIVRDAEDEHKREVEIEKTLYRRKITLGQDKSLAKAELDKRVAESRLRLQSAREEAQRVRYEINRPA
tara:strand:- start:3750 stop:4103 length:354 start_codon:yes stop_codon:yes gene_type:complete